jgi:hypothetical protein
LFGEDESMSFNLSQNNPVSVQIGSLVYTAVKAFGDKLQGAGGGDMVSSQTVANDENAVGHTRHPKETVIVATIDGEHAKRDMQTARYATPNEDCIPVPSIVYKCKRNDGKVMTVTYSGLIDVKNCEIKLVNVEGQSGTNPVTEIEFLFTGTVTYSTWDNP